MSELKVTAKGQITLRKEVLRHLGVQPGAKVEVELLPDGRVVLRKKGGHDISKAFGMFNYEGPAKTIEEIDEITQKGWAGEL